MRINPAPPTSWKDLQTQTALILTECGLSAEVEKTIKLVRGTAEVDVLAVDSTQSPPQKIACECKHWATPISKEKVHAFRTVVSDFGANTGYLISSAGFQSGAHEAAESTNVHLQTWSELEATWMERWINTYLYPRLNTAAETVFSYTDPVIGGNLVTRLDKLPKEKQDKFIALRGDPSFMLVADLASHLGLRAKMEMGEPKLELPYKPRIAADAEHLPPKLLKTDSLREFGDIICDRVAELRREIDDVFRVE